MISLGRLFALTVQCSQNPSPPGMNDVSVSVLSGRDWLITRCSQHFTQLHTSERKKSADKIISHNSHPGLITGILRTDVSCVRFPALIPATWAKSAVCSGAVLVSTACCKLNPISFSLPDLEFLENLVPRMFAVLQQSFIHFTTIWKVFYAF